jgi:5'-nucleotidase
MNILLTNDDGYEAIGIQELHKSLGVNNQVFLIAPKDNCSGMSAAISLRKEIEVQEIDKNIYAVSGTPADCSYLGLLSIISEPIDMIVSGINLGANLGEDIFYSGTVGAAIAGRRLSYVPVAFSVAAFAPKNLLVNVNFPDLPESKIAGIKITTLGKRGIPDIPDLIRKNESSSFYSFGPSGALMPDQVNTDMQAIKDNYISISILDYNLTATDSDWQIFETAFTDA